MPRLRLPELPKTFVAFLAPHVIGAVLRGFYLSVVHHSSGPLTRRMLHLLSLQAIQGRKEVALVSRTSSYMRSCFLLHPSTYRRTTAYVPFQATTYLWSDTPALYLWVNVLLWTYE